MIELVSIELTNACAKACWFCYNHSSAAGQTRWRPDDVVSVHAAATFRVEFFGFVAGFGYLSGLPSALAIPRLATPRTLVPAGSVALGGAQCGIYPAPTPGGWRLIGRTPLRPARFAETAWTRFRAGDRLRFVPISSDEFERRSEWR